MCVKLNENKAKYTRLALAIINSDFFCLQFKITQKSRSSREIHVLLTPKMTILSLTGQYFMEINTDYTAEYLWNTNKCMLLHFHTKYLKTKRIKTGMSNC